MEEKVERVQGPKPQAKALALAIKAYVSDWDHTLTKIHTFAGYQLARFELPFKPYEIEQLNLCPPDVVNIIIALIREGFKDGPSILKDQIPQCLFDPFAESICAIATYHNNDCIIMGGLLYLMISRGLIVLDGKVLQNEDLLDLEDEELDAIIDQLIVNRTMVPDKYSPAAISSFSIKDCPRPLYICHIPATGDAFKAIAEEKLHGKNEMLLFIEQSWKDNGLFEGNSISFYEDTAKNIDWLANEAWEKDLRHIEPFLVDRIETFTARRLSIGKPAPLNIAVPDTPRAPVMPSARAVRETKISAAGKIPFYAPVPVSPGNLSAILDNNAPLRRQFAAFHESALPVKLVDRGHCLLLQSQADRENVVSALKNFGLAPITSFDNWGSPITCKDLERQHGTYFHYLEDWTAETVVALTQQTYQDKWVLSLSIGAMEMYYAVSKYAYDVEEATKKAATSAMVEDGPS